MCIYVCIHKLTNIFLRIFADLDAFIVAGSRTVYSVGVTVLGWRLLLRDGGRRWVWQGGWIAGFGIFGVLVAMVGGRGMVVAGVIVMVVRRV